MQSVDIEAGEEEKLEKLEQDFNKPFSSPDGIVDHIPKDHPSLDSGIDPQEWYDEGRSGAAEIRDNSPVVVKSYHKISSLTSQNGPVRIIKPADISRQD